MIQKLFTQTKVKRDPKTKELLFLLHRGMGPEIGGYSQSKDPYAEHSSWTPRKDIAKQFTTVFDSLEEGQEPGELISAWIPESKISYYVPFATSKEKKDISNYREHEVIVKDLEAQGYTRNPHSGLMEPPGTLDKELEDQASRHFHEDTEEEKDKNIDVEDLTALNFMYNS